MAATGTELLNRAFEYLEREVAPKANEIDRSESALGQALQGLRDLQLMALRRPEKYGGPDLSELEFRNFQEQVARVSGSLAFLQTQHQSAVRMIAKSADEAFKQRYLPHVADELLMGIGFSQLRRKGPPILTATPADGGYLINGTVPWATGHSYFSHLLIGAALPSGEAVFGVAPFSDSGDGRIRYDGPMRLAAMETPRTMVGQFDSWLLPSEDVAFIQPAGWIEGNDMLNVALQAWFALGCARAGLDIVQEVYGQKGQEFIREAWESLDAELSACRNEIAQNLGGVEERLRSRAWSIDLAVRCAHAAVACSSGRANSIEHNAQRVYREALVYTVSAQTGEIMKATLERLVQRGHLDS